MNYADITESIEQLDNLLQRRDEFIRQCADLLIQRLTSDETGFPTDTVRLQAIDAPITETRPYHSLELPTDDNDGRRGFRNQEGCGKRGWPHQRIRLVRTDPGRRSPGLFDGLVPRRRHYRPSLLRLLWGRSRRRAAAHTVVEPGASHGESAVGGRSRQPVGWWLRSPSAISLRPPPAGRGPHERT